MPCFRALVLLVLSISTSLCLADSESVEIEGASDLVLVSSPTSVNSETRYPAIFFFHGTGGSASTGPMNELIEDMPCFLIGMPYRNQGLLSGDNGTIQDEFDHFRSVREGLLEKFPIDSKRIFVAGFSKGGWISAFLLEAEASVAGAISMGAGAIDGMDILDPRAASGKPIYIGIGIEDKNQINSVRLRERMRQLGAKPTLEQWDETGHSFPSGPGAALGLRQWLRLQLAPDTVDSAVVRNWAGERLKEIRAMDDDGRKFLSLLRFKSLPFLALLGPQGQRILDQEIAAVRQTEAGSREAQAWERFERLIEDELADRSATSLRNYAEKHNATARDFPETVSAKYSTVAAARIAEVLGQ